MRRLLFTLSVVFLVAACDEGPMAVEEDLVAPQFKTVVTGQDDISFTGSSTFNVFLPRSGTWFLEDFRCPIEDAVLTFGDGYDVVLTTTEGGACGGRILIWPGKLTPGGAVKLYLDELSTVLVAEHTGCALNGTASPPARSTSQMSLA
jgi:hypothetical protein